MMKSKKTLTLLVMTFFSTSISAADSFYIQKTQSKGDFEIGTADSVTELIKSNFTEMGQTLTSAKKADFQISSHLLKLGQSYIITMTKIKKGNPVFSTKLKASRVEELDLVTKRLSRAIINNRSASRDSRVDDVTEDEVTRGTHRKKSNQSMYLAIGGTWAQNLNDTNISFYGAIAKSWEINPMRIELFADAGIPPMKFVRAGLGASYYFTNRDISPHIGLDLSYGFTQTENIAGFLSDITPGFFIGGKAGVTFLRTADMNLDISLKYGLQLSDSPVGSKASFLALALGVYFN